MTETAFKKIVWSDNASDNGFNYFFVVSFIALGLFWLFNLNVTDVSIYKAVLGCLSVVLPFVFAFYLARSITRNTKVITLDNNASQEDKKAIVKAFLASKKGCKELSLGQPKVRLYEYQSRLKIPLYLYVYIDDQKVLFNIRRKDNFLIKELFDFGLATSDRMKFIHFFEEYTL